MQITLVNVTERQKDILRAIIDFTKTNKYPPTVREIGKIVGIKSSSTVQTHLEKLKLNGLLSWEESTPRTFVVMEDRL